MKAILNLVVLIATFVFFAVSGVKIYQQSMISDCRFKLMTGDSINPSELSFVKRHSSVVWNDSMTVKEEIESKARNERAAWRFFLSVFTFVALIVAEIQRYEHNLYNPKDYKILLSIGFAIIAATLMVGSFIELWL